MWPGASSRPSATIRRTCSASAGHGAKEAGRSRLPWTAYDGPRRRTASVSETRKSTPTTSAPAAPMAGSSSPVPTPKWMRVRGLHGGQGRRGVRLHVPLVVGQRQRPDPRVEELDRAGAGLGLHPEEGAGDLGQAAQRSFHSAGSPYIIALVCSWLRLGPPSTRYEAKVNGAPANPTSGVAPRASVMRRTDSAMSGTWSESAWAAGPGRPGPGPASPRPGRCPGRCRCRPPPRRAGPRCR